VLPAVSAHVLEWSEQGLQPVTVRVAASRSALQADALPDIVERAFHARACSPDALEIAAPEALLEGAADGGCSPLLTLQTLGVAVTLRTSRFAPAAVDWARRLGLEAIDVDLAAINKDGALCARAPAFVAEARASGLSVTGRLVHSGAELERQRELGCERLQGSALTGPLRADEVAAHLRPQAEAALVPHAELHERREHHRLSVLLRPDRLERGSATAADREPIDATIVDLSERGMQLRLTGPLWPSEDLYVTVALPGDPDPAPLRLQVRAVDQAPISATLALNSEFVGVSLLEKRRIARFIAREEARCKTHGRRPEQARNGAPSRSADMDGLLEARRVA
jgi:EAL domain-containing protein (putative c-di-GMP-specific phosphodiesterase class I)